MPFALMTTLNCFGIEAAKDLNFLAARASHFHLQGDLHFVHVLGLVLILDSIFENLPNILDRI
jgi:hypothetical protein